jgi:hypothetical protein
VRQGTERGWREAAVATTAYPSDIIPERIIGMNNVPEPRMPRVENPRVPRSYGRYLVALYTTMSGRTLLWPRMHRLSSHSAVRYHRHEADPPRTSSSTLRVVVSGRHSCPATSFRRDQRDAVWSALVIQRRRKAPKVSACLCKSRTRPRQAADGAWAISSSHVSSTAALNLTRSACAARAR